MFARRDARDEGGARRRGGGGVERWKRAPSVIEQVCGVFGGGGMRRGGVEGDNDVC